MSALLTEKAEAEAKRVAITASFMVMTTEFTIFRIYSELRAVHGHMGVIIDALLAQLEFLGSGIPATP